VDSLTIDGLEELRYIIQISLIKHYLCFCLTAILLFCAFSIVVSSLLALALVGQKICLALSDLKQLLILDQKFGLDELLL